MWTPEQLEDIGSWITGKMSKKHYILLASILRNHVAVEQLAGSDLSREKDLIYRISNIMQKDNKNFDKVRFREACGL